MDAGASHSFAPAENARRKPGVDTKLDTEKVVSYDNCTGKSGDPDGANNLTELSEHVIILVESVDMVRARQERMDACQRRERHRQSKRDVQIFILLMFIVLLILVLLMFIVLLILVIILLTV